MVLIGFSSNPDSEAKAAQTHHPRRDVMVKIDTKKSTLILYIHDVMYRKYPVALGKKSSPTPVGNWVIVDKQTGWGSGFGTRWMALNVPWGTYGIHGTNRPHLIGQYVSSGCVRMLNRDVEELYQRVPLGTPVIITGNPLANLRNLGDGDVGADVLLVQRRLHKLGFYRGPLNGRFDGSTKVSLQAFERSHGLHQDGVVGKREYWKLGLIK